MKGVRFCSFTDVKMDDLAGYKSGRKFRITKKIERSGRDLLR